MNYKLVNVDKDKINILVDYKLDTIISDDISDEEKMKIIDYVKTNSLNQINNSYFIIVNDNIIGCLVKYSYLDGILLDELYLECDYRHKGIGSDILKNIISENEIVYLWVYKNNDIAFNLYKKIGFNVDQETETRYFMKYERELNML